MLFACLVIAHAVYDQSAEPVEVKIHHMRASKALEIIEQSNPKSLPAKSMDADDSKGSVTVSGSPEMVKEFRDLAKLIDIPRKRLSIKVTVDSEVDKESYQVSAKIWNNQKWKTSDGDTGITVAVEPRLSDHNTVTLMVVCGHDGVSSIQETFRMKFGTSRTLTLGSQISRMAHQQPDGSYKFKIVSVPEPKITIRVDP